MTDQLALEVDPRLRRARRRAPRRRRAHAARRPAGRARRARARDASCSTAPSEPPADGPWRCAVAGGVRAVSTRAAESSWRPQTGQGAVPRWASSAGGDAVLLGLGRLGGVAGAAHRAPGRAVELVLAAVAAVGRDGGRVAARLALGDALQRGGGVAAGAAPSASSAACVLWAPRCSGRARRSVCGPATPSTSGLGALEALDGGAGLRAVDAVGADAELLLQGAHGVGALHAGRQRASRRPGRARRRRRQETARRPASRRRGRAGRCGGAAPAATRRACEARSERRHGTGELRSRCIATLTSNPPVVSSPTGLADGLAL